MPHISIKHLPAPLTDEQATALVDAVSDAVRTAFAVPDDVISIAVEAVPKDDWHETVYVPEIVNRAGLLRKKPNY